MAKKKATSSLGGDINIREELEKYLRYWPWFVLCAVLALGFAYLKLRHTTPIYSSSATILIKENDNSKIAAFSELGMFSGMDDNGIEDEIGIMKSRHLMERVVEALNLNIRYFDEDILRSPELFGNSPFIAETIGLNEEVLRSSPHKSYRLLHQGGNKVEVTRLTDDKTFMMEFGQPVDFGFGEVLLRKNEIGLDSDLLNRPILLQFESVRGIAGVYRKNLSVEVKQKSSKMVELTLNDPVRAKAEDILDRLILEYNKEAIKDKNLVAMNTAEFIQERLAIINTELDSVETGKVEFKESNNFVSMESTAELFSSSAQEYEQRIKEVEMQIELAEAMQEYLDSSNSSDLLPANLGIAEGGVNTGIQAYNTLVLERNRILSGSTDRNPTVIKLNRQIEELRESVLQSLNRMRANLDIEEETLNRQAGVIGARISTVPSKEKQFMSIERQRQIKEALYLFLLQKREENSLTLAVTSPKAKVVDEALSVGGPISPDPKNMYLTALLIGFGIPFGLVYLKNLLNNKVRSKADIERVVDIPVVGEIPKLTRNQKDLIEKNDRSVLAESFRILHTNLQYLLVSAGKKPGGETIFVTSTIKGEGKTFSAFNLAMTLANAKKKIIIVGADLRNPQLQRFEPEIRQQPGVTDYLVDEEMSLGNLIQSSTFHPNLSVLPSGNIPPNPSELWRQERTTTLFSELAALYDYVIVDTAPLMLVTDTFLINEYADLTLYVVRAGYTESKLLHFAEEAKDTNKLGHVGFILNDVDSAHFGYGNKYGYGYVYGEKGNGFLDKLKRMTVSG